ncbi:MAG: Nif3-like dinuclear metal center hexameric protein [Sulfurospirillaceae bacterium]|nr:Nif3-like dinuclear metal center hexameric protein [Sulfurospirillaceae bacterium]
MQVREIYDLLDEISPFSSQASWDNSGLNVGSMNSEVQRVYLGLDVDSFSVEEMENESLLIVHHPLIFKELKSLNFDRYPSSLIQKLIRKNISVVAMHTNFDLSHLNRYVVSEVLGFKTCVTEEYICYFEPQTSFEEIVLDVKKAFGMETTRVVKCNNFVQRCALTTGSGGDLINRVDADCFISGDLKYHTALEARENSLSLIEVGHFESEQYFSECLSFHLKNLPLKVIMSNYKNPFEYR